MRNALMHSVAQNANSTLMSALSKAGDLPQKLDNIIKKNEGALASVFQVAEGDAKRGWRLATSCPDRCLYQPAKRKSRTDFWAESLLYAG